MWVLSWSIDIHTKITSYVIETRDDEVKKLQWAISLKKIGADLYITVIHIGDTC